jgi:hypothetical protein
MARWSPSPQPESVTLAAPPATEPERAPQPAPTAGQLWISTEPWADVVIDGVRVGRTPVMGSPIAPGYHQVRLEHDGYEPVDRTITVESGGEVRLTGIRLTLRQ